MSVRTGPFKELLASGTPASTVTALPTFKAAGNSTKLLVDVTVGGAGSLHVVASHSSDGVTWYEITESDAAWAREFALANVVGAYEFFLDGLPTVPGDTVKLSYYCDNAAGTLALASLNFENPGNVSALSESASDDTVDPVSLASRTEQINKDSAEALHIYLVEEANVAADTYRVMWDRKRFLSGAIQWDISGGVTLKIYATSSQDADTTSLTGWHDVTDLLTGSVTQVDNDDVAYYDTDLVSVAFMVQYVTSDTTNDVNVWVSESKK